MYAFDMIKMQMACLVIVLFLCCIYFSAKRAHSYAHRLFSMALIMAVINLVFDMVTVYTVNHLKTVSPVVNHICHQIFIGSLVAFLYVTFAYILMLIKSERMEKGKEYRHSIWWFIPLVFSLLGVSFGKLYYKETPLGNYSYGPAANMAYISVGVYLVFSLMLLLRYYRVIHRKKRNVVMIAMACEFTVMVYQALHPTALLSGLGVTLLVLAFFLTVESPDMHMIELLEAETERANQANAAKSAFLANMSHEIRTPINAVLGMNEMILRETNQSNIQTYATDVQNATKTLLGIVNDILDLSKIESGKMEIIPVEYKLDEMLSNLYRMISLKASAKGLHLHLIVDESLPNGLFGDDIRIKQVMTNLLTNAVKYTHQGDVTCRIENKGLNMDSCFIMFSVQDTGIGIKQEDMKKLFEAFQRVEEKRNRNIEGTGLGMAITKKILSLMNSTLKVESTYGEGSTFSFIIEQKVIDDTLIGDFNKRYLEKQQRTSYQAKFQAPNANILVVDDNPMNCNVFIGLLKQTKMAITAVHSGKECLKEVQAKTYQMIFLDHMMPDMDGIETLHKLKQLECNRSKDAIVIALTANAISGARELYIKEGFDEYLSKPFDPNQLELLIQEKLPSEFVLSETKEQENDEEYHSVTGDYYAEDNQNADDDMHFHELFEQLKKIEQLDVLEAVHNCGSEQLAVVTMKDFSTMIPGKIELLGELVEHLGEPESVERYRIEIHSIKSAAYLIGAMQAGDLAKELEEVARNQQTDLILKNHAQAVMQLQIVAEDIQQILKDNSHHMTKQWNEKEWLLLLNQLVSCVEQVDVDRADDLIEQLGAYDMTDSLKQMYGKLSEAIVNLDEGMTKKVIGEIKEVIANE